MKKYKKIIIFGIIFIVAGIVVIVLINKNNNSQKTNAISQMNDETIVFKNGEVLSDIQIKDRYGKIFNIEDYKNKPILFVFPINNNEYLIKYYKELSPLIKENISKGLQLVFVALEINYVGRPDTLEKNNNLHVYYETDKADFLKKFRRKNCCDAMILIDKNHEVVLNSISYLPPQTLAKIVNNKCLKIFSGKKNESI